MSEDSATNHPPSALFANVGGEVIVARSITDAAVLNLAVDILNEAKPKRRDPTFLFSIAKVLDAYGLVHAARALRERCNSDEERMR